MSGFIVGEMKFTEYLVLKECEFSFLSNNPPPCESE